MALYGGAASRTPLLGPETRSLQPFTRTFQTPAQIRAATKPPGTPPTTKTITGVGGVNVAALDALRKAKELYEPGGGFGKGIEAGLERGRVKAMASGMQHLVGAGLAGTTLAGGLGKRYEEEVGMPARMGVEERRAQALSGISMQEAGMGFQAGQAGVQRQFQAGQAGAQRDLQRYIADLQATLQREQMASRGPTITAPTGGGYAKQFPSLYDTTEERVPDWTGGGTTAETPWPTPAQGFWGASEQWRSEQPAWVTG